VCVCVCVVELHVTVNNTEILSIAQQCLCGNFVLPTAINVRKSTCKVPAAVLKQKHVRLLIAFCSGNDRLSVFVSAVLQYFTRLEGINQL